MNNVIAWDVYEISSSGSIQGVMFRGRVRKFCLEEDVTCLLENASDVDNVVRFAVPKGSDVTAISDFIISLMATAQITLVLPAVKNPVLSKLKVNDESRYTLE